MWDGTCGRQVSKLRKVPGHKKLYESLRNLPVVEQEDHARIARILPPASHERLHDALVDAFDA